MYLEQGQIVYHQFRGKCVFVGKSGEYKKGSWFSHMVPVVCIDPVKNETSGLEPYFEAFTMFLLVETKPKPEPEQSLPLVIKGQGSYTITITEGDI